MSTHHADRAKDARTEADKRPTNHPDPERAARERGNVAFLEALARAHEGEDGRTR